MLNGVVVNRDFAVFETPEVRDYARPELRARVVIARRGAGIAEDVVLDERRDERCARGRGGGTEGYRIAFCERDVVVTDDIVDVGAEAASHVESLERMVERAIAHVERVLERTFEGDKNTVAPVMSSGSRRRIGAVLESVASEIERDIGRARRGGGAPQVHDAIAVRGATRPL